MFTKKIPIFLKVQLIILVVIGAVLIMGDKSQPKIRFTKNILLVNQPIIITFDRPMKRDTVEKGLKLMTGDSEVEGTYSWSSRSVAFIPEKPLAHSTPYRLSLSDIEDKENHVLKKPFIRTIRTSEARFIYLTPDKSLKLVTVGSQVPLDLSDKTEKIIDYSVSGKGDWLLATYQDSSDERTYGIFSVRITPQGVKEKKLLYKGRDRTYSTVRICGPSSTALVSESILDKEGLIIKNKLVSFSLVEKGFQFDKRTILLTEKEIPSSDSIECSEQSEQFMYQSSAGNVMLGSLSEPIGDPLGSYKFAYGFSPKGTRVLVGDTSSGELPTNRVAYAFDVKGLRELISSTDVDSAYPAYNPTEDIVALSQDVPELSNEQDFYSHFKIVLYQKNRGTTKIRSVTSGLQEHSDDRPRWSLDGRFIAFERNFRDRGQDSDRPRNNEGEPIDGELWIAELDPNKDVLMQEPVIRSLGVRGSNLKWLP